MRDLGGAGTEQRHGYAKPAGSINPGECEVNYLAP